MFNNYYYIEMKLFGFYKKYILLHNLPNKYYLFVCFFFVKMKKKKQK